MSRKRLAGSKSLDTEGTLCCKERPSSPARRANRVNAPAPDTVTEANDAKSAQRQAGSGASSCYAVFHNSSPIQ